MPSINICICTCKRNKLLVQCLESVARVEVPSGVGVTVTVIDNNEQLSPGGTVRSPADQFPFSLIYAASPAAASHSNFRS